MCDVHARLTVTARGGVRATCRIGMFMFMDVVRVSSALACRTKFDISQGLRGRCEQG